VNDRREPEWAMVTVMFADIRGFTAFADRSTAREAVTYLNEFFGLIVPPITRNGGGTHQLLGDGLLAIFESGDHADRALAAAHEMLAAVDAHMGDRCRMGVGLNSGLVLIGSIGGEELDELAVIGDPVNVASHVQDATRDLGERVLMTEATRALLENGRDGLQPRGELALKGKAAAVAVYAPAQEIA
jgi:adenylate cyclase